MKRCNSALFNRSPKFFLAPNCAQVLVSIRTRRERKKWSSVEKFLLWTSIYFICLWASNCVIQFVYFSSLLESNFVNFIRPHIEKSQCQCEFQFACVVHKSINKYALVAVHRTGETTVHFCASILRVWRQTIGRGAINKMINEMNDSKTSNINSTLHKVKERTGRSTVSYAVCTATCVMPHVVHHFFKLGQYERLRRRHQLLEQRQRGRHSLPTAKKSQTK